MKERMLLHVDDAVAIAGRAAGGARLALAGEPQLRAVVHAGGDIDLAGHAARHVSRCRGSSGTLRGSPCRCRGRRGRWSAWRRCRRIARPGRCRRSRSRLRACVPGLAPEPPQGSHFAWRWNWTILAVPWAASKQVQRRRRTGCRRPCGAAAAAAAAAEEVAEEPFAEDVAEGLEDVADVVELRGAAACQPGVAVAVVGRPLVRMAEDLEGLGRLLEPGDGLLVARIAVRVILHGELAIGFGDLAACWRSAPRPGLHNSRVCRPSSPWAHWSPAPDRLRLVPRRPR